MILKDSYQDAELLVTLIMLVGEDKRMREGTLAFLHNQFITHEERKKKTTMRQEVSPGFFEGEDTIRGRDLVTVVNIKSCLLYRLYLMSVSDG